MSRGAVAATVLLTSSLLSHGVSGAIHSARAWHLAGPAVKIVPFPYEQDTTNSASMEPTVHCARRNGHGCEGKVADALLVELSGARYARRGDLVAYRIPPSAVHACGEGGFGLKRVIGVGGDRIRERGGQLWLNGKQLREPYVPAQERDSRSGSVLVPRGYLFVMGDNRRLSCDSRDWGPLNKSYVIGRVVEILRTGLGGTDPTGPPIVHRKFPYLGLTDQETEMEPTIRCQRGADPECTGRFADEVLVELSGPTQLQRGSIVYFRLPSQAIRECHEENAFERVIGLGGDTVVETLGSFVVNGHRLVEPYVLSTARDRKSGKWHVPTGSLFVMADYRTRSCDSRRWGPLKASLVFGQVTKIIRAK